MGGTEDTREFMPSLAGRSQEAGKEPERTMGEGKLWRKEDTKRKDIPHVLKETKQRETNIPEDRVEDMGRKSS